MGLFSKKQRLLPRRRLAGDATDSGRPSEAQLEQRYAFRRNRTLTGSLSSNVATINEDSAELKSPRVHAHHLKRKRKHTLGILFAVAVVSFGLGYLIYQSIASVQVRALSTLPEEARLYYQSKIMDYLEQRPLERFRFSLDEDALVAHLRSSGAPEVMTIEPVAPAEKLGLAALTVHFRRPVVYWQTGNVRMYVDSQGSAFQKNHFPEPSVKVVDQTGIQAHNNQVLASSRFLGFIGRVIGGMEAYSYPVAEIVLPADTTRQVQVKLRELAYPLKFSVDRSVGEQVEDAARAINYFQQQGLEPEYIDVRVSGKAFYK